MKTFALLVTATAMFAAQVSGLKAQTATGTGNATSGSASQAISRSQGGTAIIAIDNPSNTTSTNSSRISGTQRIISAPPVGAPALAAAGIETCLGSVSAGASFPGGGFTFGSTTKDDDCNRRLFGRQLYNMGFKRAAMVIHCFNVEVAQAMAIAGTPCPGVEVAVTSAYPVRAAPAQPATPLRPAIPSRQEIIVDPSNNSRYGRTVSNPAAVPPPPDAYAALQERLTRSGN